jgi:3-oxoacyl-[acyl-carrier-protein] synthase II
VAREPARVVITGAGIITALGLGWRDNAAGFRMGKTAFRHVTLFDVSGQRVRSAAEVKLPAALPVTKLSRKQEHRMDRASRLLLHAAHEAWEQAGWSPTESLPVVLGTTSGGMSQGETYYRQSLLCTQLKQAAFRKQPTRALQYLAQRQALDLAEAFGFAGPVTIIANACASGANAVGHAWDLVRRGRAPRVLTGGYDALSHLVFAGFDSLQALSPTQCRPFDANRDGLALGEGAAVLCLERLEAAQRRGAQILGEIAGYGAATDCHHLTQPHPEGRAALAAMRQACEVAHVDPTQVEYINAHGTGTPLNDAAETIALNTLLGTAAARASVSSTKSSVGHLLGGAGAVEALVCIMGLREQWLPPTSTLDRPDPACAFRLVRKPMDCSYQYALSNSFGFGGANASLLFRQWS